MHLSWEPPTTTDWEALASEPDLQMISKAALDFAKVKKFNTEKLGSLLGWWQELMIQSKKHAKKHDENAAAQEQEAASQKTSKDEQESLTFF